MEPLTPPNVWATEVIIDEAKGCQVKINDLVLATIDDDYFTISFTDILQKIKSKLILLNDSDCSITFTPVEKEIMKINSIYEKTVIYKPDNIIWTHLNISKANLRVVGDADRFGYYFKHKYSDVRALNMD